MKLFSGNGGNGPKDLEGVLSILDRRLYNSGDSGVVLDTGLGAEAAADLELGLGGSESLLAVVVRRWDSGVGQEGEDVISVLRNAFLEPVKFGILPVFLCVYWWPGEQFVKPLLHLRSHILLDVSQVSAVDGVLEKIHHVETPCVIGEGLHRVGEIPQQMSYAYLVVLHPDVGDEVGRPSVGHPSLAAKLLRGKVVIYDIVPSALVERKIGRYGVLEGPEPVVLAVDIYSGLVRPGDLSVRDLLADHLVRSLGEFSHGVEHIGYGTFADVKPEYGLKQMREPFERNILIGAQIGHERGDVRSEGCRSVDLLGELPLAAVPAGALDLHLKMFDDFCGNGKRDIHNLSCCAHSGGVHIQRFSADRANCRREPVLRIGNVFGLKPCASLMPLLSSGLFPGRLTQGLRVRNAYGILGRRHAAVRAGLDYRLLTSLKFRDAGFEFRNLHFIMGNAAVQSIVGESLFVKLLRNLRRFEIFGVPHLTKELLASASKLYSVRFYALAKRRTKEEDFTPQ